MEVGFWLYKSRHTLTALANCARGLPPAAGYQRIGWWHGPALYGTVPADTHGSAGCGVFLGRVMRRWRPPRDQHGGRSSRLLS